MVDIKSWVITRLSYMQTDMNSYFYGPDTVVSEGYFEAQAMANKNYTKAIEALKNNTIDDNDRKFIMHRKSTLMYKFGKHYDKKMLEAYLDNL